MKNDEFIFLKAMCSGEYQTPRDYIQAGRINHKRGWYLLDKWSGKGWYDYGVTLDLGWMTNEGKIAVERG